MKKLLFILLIATVITSCNKTTNNAQLKNSKTYTIEGYLYSRQSDGPVVGKLIAISQTERIYSHTDAQTITDSNGYFKFIHSPNNDKKGLNIYPVYKDYSCIYDDISFITNIPKYQNVDLKKIYTSKFH